MSVCVLGNSQTADVIGQACRARGRRVLRQRIDRASAESFAETMMLQRFEVEAFVWIDEPLPPHSCAALARMAGQAPFIDMGWVVRPLRNAREHRALIAQVTAASAANRRYVPCVLPALEGTGSNDGDGLPAILVCCDDAGPKLLARELLREVGRRTFDTGPLQSLRYLDPSTLRMFAEA